MINFFKNVSQFFFSLLKIGLLSKLKSKHKRYKVNKDEVIILANGPSLNDDMANPDFVSKVKESDSACVNHFAKSEYFKILKPKYYILAAPEFWAKGVDDFYSNFRLDVFNDIAKNTAWKMLLFVPFEAKKNLFWKKIIGENEQITVVYFNHTALEGSRRVLNFFFNKKLGMPRLHNILGPSLMNMIWLGYKKIYLSGVDHSWIPLIHVTEDNVAMVGQPHFYDADAKPEPMRRFENQRKLFEILEKFQLTFKGYFYIKDYADSSGVEIINLTKGSFIDAFKRETIGNYTAE